jgi:hypothetical protein
MWWFLNKSRPAALSAEQSKREQAEQGLLDAVPDMSRLDDHNVAVKIWLPERVAQTMKWLADYEGINQSNWVRSHLASYVYGHVAVLAQQIRERQLRVEENRIMFSRGSVDRGAGRWVYLVPQLGKNTVAFKVWVSQQMRDDLQVLAAHAGVALSPFVREALIGALLGRGSLPERPEIMGQPSPAALAWESGEDAPVDTLEEHEHARLLPLGEVERVWVSADDAMEREFG